MGLLLGMLLSCFIPQQHSISGVKTIAVVETFTIGPPVQRATWQMNPRIRVCESTTLSMFRTQKAIKYWEKLGYDFDGVSIDYNIDCMRPRYGEIIITLPEGNIDSKHMAATRIYTEKVTGNIAKVKIFIYPKDAMLPRVIEHEIGHALGWMHYSQRYHIMHPNWHLGGDDGRGLRKRID